MKRICVLLISSFIALTVSAQKSVTKFLGIPVDGFKSELISLRTQSARHGVRLYAQAQLRIHRNNSSHDNN